jgi:energy-coupling factor transporter ATP-binding protein EcfA2
MQLTYVRIKNLRCIKNSEIHIRNFTSLIGPNNCGKSSFLRGIELLLNQLAPSPEEWRSGYADEEIEIEAEFAELQEWERMAPGVAGIVHDGKIRLRLRAKLDDAGEKVEVVYEALVPRIEIEGWSDTWGTLSDEIKILAASLGIKGPQWKSAASKGAVRTKIKEQMPDRVTIGASEWSSENISIKQALQQALPQAQIIPAVRDASDDAKPGAKTSFGLLLSKIILPAVQSSTEYQELLAAVEKIRAKLGCDGAEQLDQVRVLSAAISERLASIINAKVCVAMEPPDAGKFVGANTSLRLDDGTNTSIALQGHGLQRSLIFALVEVLANQMAKKNDMTQDGQNPNVRSTILLFEEPELFFHPHIMRRLKRALQAISKQEAWQVIVSTHSPFLIDIADDPLSLAIFKRVDHQVAPSVHQLSDDPFGDDEDAKRDREALRAVLNFHPTVCEAFFATRTILVEGPSELAVLCHQLRLYELAGIDMQRRADCTVVSCSGKWTIAPIANLLQKFGISFRIIHDCDAKGRTPEQLAECAPIDPFRANARIAVYVSPENLMVIDDTLEDILWDTRPTSSGDKPFRAWKRVSELCDDHENLDHTPKLRDMVRFAFNWGTAQNP